MATAAAAPEDTAIRGNTRFFTIMAFVMSFIIVAGFVVNLAFARSTFDVPWPYHVHGVIFMSWLGIYCGQHLTASQQNWALHAKFGKIAYLWVPLMVIFGTVIMVVVARRTGGPFFFHVSEFLWSNTMLVWLFGGLTFWALSRRRYTGWHRRLMLCGMAILTGPGLGRLLPLPLMIPNAWLITTICTMIFPVIGMIADKRKHGRVHPAYWWGLGLYIAVFAISVLLAHSSFGMGITEQVITGTPGAERPMEAFLPPGFAM
ncbi:hypothetical protein [Qipengyuania sphaerica]|uniref:hypothetical protein n=1 Tax=Qipengyuania sphaerica TaxID=2867243 RepID=UPI001C875312|nr:hypothetical protein [Qipengyuania sphaerica]MBX7539845.1 hypothetical protein [Qipengyuania sphaerica]